MYNNNGEKGNIRGMVAPILGDLPLIFLASLRVKKLQNLTRLWGKAPV